MTFRIVAGPESAGMRVDQVVTDARDEFSRAQVRRLIEAGDLRVDGQLVKASHRLRGGESIEGTVPEPEPSKVEPEDIPLHVVYEDAHLVVVDKPAGLVVHPAAGHRTGTLVNALLYHCSELSGVGGVRRPGIVHRLDKDTSGLLVCAKTDRGHRGLAAQFVAHRVDREYLALVRGSPGATAGSIDAPIGRHPRDRKKFSTRARTGRDARTHWELVQRLGELTLLRVKLETGRTHQIRVHLASVGLPVAGDPVYGGGRSVARLLGLERQALHAAVLGFEHPAGAGWLRFTSELPDDLARVVKELQA